MTPRLRVVIADDERPARSFLAALLRSFDDVVIVAEAGSGKEAVAAIEQEHPDLVLDLANARARRDWGRRRLLKKAMPLVAFVTAYDEYHGQSIRGERGRLPAEAGGQECGCGTP